MLASLQNQSSSPTTSEYEQTLLKNLQKEAAANQESCDATLQKLAKELAPILLSRMSGQGHATISDSRDAQRRADVNAILNAVYQYWIDKNGKYPAAFTGTDSKICAQNSKNCTDLTVLKGTYLVNIPKDPSYKGPDSGYTIRLKDSKLTVSAPHAEGSTPITVTR